MWVCLIIQAAIVLHPRPAGTQPSQEMSLDIQALAEGVGLWTLNYFRADYKQHILILEIDGHAPNLEVHAALGDGLWGGERIETIRKREEAIAAWQAEEQAPGGGSVSWPGLTVVEGRLVSAPGGGPILAITHSGYASLREAGGSSSGSAGILAATDGTNLPLGSVNRLASTDTLLLAADPGVVRHSLLSGDTPMVCAALSFSPVEPLRFDWGSQTDALDWTPLPWNATTNGTFHWSADSPPDGRPASGAFPVDWVGVAGVGPSAESLRAFLSAAPSGNLQLTTTPPWIDYRTVVPLRGWLVRDSRVVVPAEVSRGDPRGQRTARSAIALRREDNRLWLVTVLDRERYAEGMTERELADLCLSLGATDAAQGPEGSGVGAAVEESQVLPPQRVPDLCRLALVIQRTEPDLSATWSNLTQLTPVLVAGTPPIDLRNGPGKAIDGREGPAPKLDQFWCSSGKDEAPPTLTFDFRKQFIIGQMDIVHAESAGFSTDFDARAFRVAWKGRDRDEFNEGVVFRNDPPRARQHVVFDPPLSARQVRLEFTEPSGLEGNRTARIVEVVFWGKES